MASNPFYVEPANAFQALMAGQQGYDRSLKLAKEDALKQGRQKALERHQAGDTQGALAELLGIGDADGAKAAATYANNVAMQQHRQAESERQASQFAQSHSLQRAQFEAQREGQRMPAGFTRSPTGGIMPIPGGPADPDYLRRLNEEKNPTGTFDNEQKLRKEFEGNAKPFLEVRRGYNRIMSSRDDAAGDISLIFGFMKTMDPGSVVREGEFATAQNAGGVSDQVRNIYNRALSGERLNAGQRNMFKKQAEALYRSAEREYGAREKQMRGIAANYRIDPARVIPSLGDEPGIEAPAVNAPAPPNGFQLVQ